MSGKLYLVIDVDRCWGCKNCITACKMSKNIPVGEGCIDVATVERLEGDRVYRDRAPVLCLQCGKAACEAACPVQAISHDGDGIVLVDRDLCVGCGSCADACPYGAIFLDEDNKAMKCDLCKERRSRGFLPSCEQHCCGHALVTCGEEELMERTRHKHVFQKGQVVYISERLRALG